MGTPKQVMWTLGTVILEGYARLQGYYDYRRKRDHHIWQMVDSTKGLQAGRYQMRRICNARSVIIFRFMLEDSERVEAIPGREEREATEAARKLLPQLRSKIRKEDKLSINGSGIMTAIIRADQHGAELVAKRMQELVQATPVRIGMRGREVTITVTYSSLAFPLQKKSGTAAFNSP